MRHCLSSAFATMRSRAAMSIAAGVFAAIALMPTGLFVGFGAARQSTHSRSRHLQRSATISPVLRPSATPESFDSAAVGGVTVEVPRVAGEKWRMWYHGRSLEADPEVVPLSMGSIGLAESDDGLHWQKSSGAVFTPSKDAAKFDSALVGMGSILGERLYYFGGSREPFALGDRSMLGVHQSIGVAFDTGTGGWNDRREILPRGDDFDAVFAASPQVVKHSAEDWRMYYHGAGLEDKKFRIGLARSRDGLTWKREGVIVSPGADGAFDEGGCSRRHVFPDGDGYTMIYEGSSAMGHAFGLAKSVDGIVWKKAGDGPIFAPSPEADAFDARAVSAPFFVPMEIGGYQGLLFYVGLDASGASSVGIAGAEQGDLSRLSRL